MSTTLELTKRIQLTPEMIKVSGLPPQSKYVGVEVATFNNEQEINDFVTFTASIGDSNSGFLDEEDIHAILDETEELPQTKALSRFRTALAEAGTVGLYYEVG